MSAGTEVQNVHGNIINPFAAYIILQTSHGSQGFYPWILWRQLVSGFQTYKGLIAFFRFRKLRIKKTQRSNQTLEVYTWNSWYSSHKVTLARCPVSQFLVFGYYSDNFETPGIQPERFSYHKSEFLNVFEARPCIWEWGASGWEAMGRMMNDGVGSFPYQWP